MILQQETIDRFGYDPNKLTLQSGKRVVVQCDYCTGIYDARKQDIEKANILAQGKCTKHACKQCKSKKQAELMMLKYGVENPGQLESVKQKIQETCLQKYGGPPAQRPEHRLSLSTHKKEYWKTRTEEQKETIEIRRQETNLDRYGVRHPCESPNKQTGSKGETEVREFLESLSGTSWARNQDMLTPYELDGYNKESKTAFEYCGIFWHSEANPHKTISPSQHIKKHDKCDQQGIRLITIFEDEWKNKRTICEERLRSIVGVSKVTYARKCETRILASKIMQRFCEDHHLAGYAPASVRYGLFDKASGVLVACMTFSKARWNKSAEWELIRYCSVGSVVGGASKLFAAFVRDHNPQSVMSYCDRRWGNGKLYQQLGFTLTGNTSPGYCYVNPATNARLSRMKCQKHKLVQQGYSALLTEHEIMATQGYYRIWDCGHSIWLWKPIHSLPTTQGTSP